MSLKSDFYKNSLGFNGQSSHMIYLRSYSHRWLDSTGVPCCVGDPCFKGICTVFQCILSLVASLLVPLLSSQSLPPAPLTTFIDRASSPRSKSIAIYYAINFKANKTRFISASETYSVLSINISLGLPLQPRTFINRLKDIITFISFLENPIYQ